MVAAAMGRAENCRIPADQGLRRLGQGQFLLLVGDGVPNHQGVLRLGSQGYTPVARIEHPAVAAVGNRRTGGGCAHELGLPSAGIVEAAVEEPQHWGRAV